MFTIHYKTTDVRPDLSVTLRSNGQNWVEDLPGHYDNDEWVFHLDEEEFPNGMEFKFVLEGQYWMLGDNFKIQPSDNGKYTYENFMVKFPPLIEVLVENGFVQQRFFKPNLDENHSYDLVVIGSGVGGGILAEQAADLGLDVLLLDAGSYLFPSHVGNLPRQHQLSQTVDKNIWGLWDDFKITNYQNVENSAFQGAQGFNFGGRSVFWGGLIPRMMWYEMERWPQEVKWYLEGRGYDLAEQLLKKSQLQSSFQSETLNFMRTQFNALDAFSAPMAIQHSDTQTRGVPSGVFSSADLLMEAKLTKGPLGSDNLTINLNHAAVKIETDNNEAVRVETYDLIANKSRTFVGKHIVLAAGTIESAKLAKLSNLRDDNQLIGKGISDHPILYTHFALPASAPLYRNNAAAKILLRHKLANENQHRYNMVLELGTDFNQGRFIDPDTLAEHQRIKANTMLCELVFLFDSALNEANQIEQFGPSYTKPQLKMYNSGINPEDWQEVNGIKNDILNSLQAQPIQNGNLDLLTAGLGGVAHEVGSLRMGDANTSVVDTNLKMHNYNNLYVCDLSVFPSSPAANPTLTLAALALRLAEHIKSVV